MSGFETAPKRTGFIIIEPDFLSDKLFYSHSPLGSQYFHCLSVTQTRTCGTSVISMQNRVVIIKNSSSYTPLSVICIAVFLRRFGY